MKIGGKLPSSVEEGMWRAATAVAERHWGGGSRREPATDLAFPRPFEPPPPRPEAAASPPYPRRGTLLPSSRQKLIRPGRFVPVTQH